MVKQKIVIPQGTITVDEMEMIAGKLFKCGYAVVRGSEKIKNKSVRIIEFYQEEKSNE